MSKLEEARSELESVSAEMKNELASLSEDYTERYPFIVRVFGAVAILAGILQIVSFVITILAFFNGQIDLANIEERTIVTIVVAALQLLFSLALAVMFVVLGVRLIRGKRRRAATLANAMLVVEVAIILCQLLLTGISAELIAPAVNFVILIILQSYSDPALASERRLQRHLKELELKQEKEEGTLGRDLSGKGYITLNFFNLFWVFVICCMLGLGIEEIYHITVVDPGQYQDRAGLLYGPFSPIYGFGAVLMTVALNRFHDKNPIIIFLVSAVIGGAFEFFTSWFMQTAFGIVAWNYSGTFLSIDGRTNGMFMCMWGLLGLVWVKLLLPLMLKIVNLIPWNWRYTVTTICATLMLADCLMTLASLDCWYQREAGTMNYENPSAIVEFCNEHYTDEYMTNRFQTMTMNPDSAARIK